MATFFFRKALSGPVSFRKHFVRCLPCEEKTALKNDRTHPSADSTALNPFSDPVLFWGQRDKFQVIFPQNGTAVLKGLNPFRTALPFWGQLG